MDDEALFLVVAQLAEAKRRLAGGPGGLDEVPLAAHGHAPYQACAAHAGEFPGQIAPTHVLLELRQIEALQTHAQHQRAQTAQVVLIAMEASDQAAFEANAEVIELALRGFGVVLALPLPAGDTGQQSRCQHQGAQQRGPSDHAIGPFADTPRLRPCALAR